MSSRTRNRANRGKIAPQTSDLSKVTDRKTLLALLLRTLHQVMAKPARRCAHKRQKNFARRDAKAAIIHRARTKSCMDCGRYFGQKHMEFDHRPGEKKRFNVGDGKWETMSRLMREIAKCDVVCCECHERREISRGRTHGEGAVGHVCPNKPLRGLLPELPPPCPKSPQNL